MGHPQYLLGFNRNYGRKGCWNDDGTIHHESHMRFIEIELERVGIRLI
jgi:hypothetical protein